jgi:hypothetical protein
VKRYIHIIPFEEYEKVTFYSFIIDENENCEMINFMQELMNNGFTKDAEIIASMIAKIGQNGTLERYFRYAGKKSDHIYELPEHHIKNAKCRLYCLRFGEVIVVLGNGGLKTTRTYQQDENLNNCVETLKQIDQQISFLLKKNQLSIEGKSLTGKLKFYIT